LLPLCYREDGDAKLSEHLAVLVVGVAEPVAVGGSAFMIKWSLASIPAVAILTIAAFVTFLLLLGVAAISALP